MIMYIQTYTYIWCVIVGIYIYMYTNTYTKDAQKVRHTHTQLELLENERIQLWSFQCPKCFQLWSSWGPWESCVLGKRTCHWKKVRLDIWTVDTVVQVWPSFYLLFLLGCFPEMLLYLWRSSMIFVLFPKEMRETFELLMMFFFLLQGSLISSKPTSNRYELDVPPLRMTGS